MSDERRFKSEDRSTAMRKYILPALAAAALAGTVSAKTPQQASTTVSFGDLDLATAEGAATLESRISAAASDVCGRPLVRDVLSGANFAKCRKLAIAGAMKQVAAIESANQALFAGR